MIVLAACGDSSDSDAEAASGGEQSEPRGEQVVVYRSPTCGCCAQYEEYLEGEGFSIQSEVTEDMDAIKDQYGVPAEAESCHTALFGDYVVEGHVPIEAIDKLLEEEPDIDGIALPGMPAGSPGMGGQKDGPWEILSLKDGAIEPYMTL